jgi:antitoxin component YwqK of YwqJK toxin-antitoxin module
MEFILRKKGHTKLGTSREEWYERKDRIERKAGENKHLNKEGLYIQRHKNGSSKIECQYKNGKKEGNYKTFHENGKLHEECEYNNNGERDGEYKRWTSGGVLTQIFTYKNGNPEGRITTCYDDGKKWRDYGWKDNKYNGSYMEWCQNGNIKIKAYHVNGLQKGEFKEWHNNNGNLKNWAYCIENEKLEKWETTYIKYHVHGWHILTKLINNKKERRMKRWMMNIKNKISQINDHLVYDLIMEYVTWDEKRLILEMIKI